MSAPVGNHSQSPVPPSLFGMPDEIIHRALEFHPDSVRALRVVSRELNRTGQDFLQLKAGEIVDLCSRANSSLYNHLTNRFAQLSLRLFSEVDRICARFYLSIPEEIRSLGVPVAECPDRILSREEISRFNILVQTVQDTNLLRMWCPLRLGIATAPHGNEELPGVRASAGVIRPWFQRHHPLLQSIRQPLLIQLDLTSLPVEIGLCTALSDLNLYSNELHSLPTGIFDGLKSMERLYLHWNLLHSLPAGTFQGLSQLRELFLCSNPLRSLPKGLFQGLGSLRHLDLQNTQLHALPEGIFQGLSQLEQLNLNNNQLHALPLQSFQGLENLGRLYLENNRLHSLPKGSFHGLANLRRLHLNDNLLSTLPEEIFQGLRKLRHLNLQDNQLHSLPAGIFQGLVRLQWLSLHNNALDTLPETIFYGLDNLRFLYLYSNPLTPFCYPGLSSSENNITFLETMDDFFSYACKTPLAKLYRLAAAGGPTDAIRQSFLRLDNTTRITLDRMLEAAHPKRTGPKWGKLPSFKKRQLFNRVLNLYVIESFDRLSSAEKTVIYGRVRVLAGAEVENLDDPDRQKLHAFSTIPRLIDAMMHRCICSPHAGR